MDLSNDNVVHVTKNGFEFLQFRRLLDLGVRHGYSLRPHDFFSKRGNISDEDYLKVAKTYSGFCGVLGIDGKGLVKPNQTHTNIVKNIEALGGSMSLEEEPYIDTDGLVTNVEGASIATVNADCILLLFYDPVKKVIGNTHSGWRGTFEKIGVNTVNEMVLNYGCNPNDIIVCICPSIRSCHFEVNEDVKLMCENKFSYINRLNEFIEYIGKNEDGVDKWRIDTVLITKILLMDCGLKEENIVDSGICSVCNKDILFSYRTQGKDAGRNTAIIAV